jgi:hypothetical protein
MPHKKKNTQLPELPDAGRKIPAKNGKKIIHNNFVSIYFFEVKQQKS